MAKHHDTTSRGAAAQSSVITRGAIVLCGGASRRMQRDKASLRFGNTSLLARTIHIVHRVVGQVVVVARDASQVLPNDLNDLDVTVVYDPQPGEGPLQAVVGGWAALPIKVRATLVCGCDMPLLQADLVEHLFQQLAMFDAVVPVVGKHAHPLLAVYAQISRETAQQCIEHGKRSMHALLQSLNVRWLRERELQDAGHGLESFTNVNDEIGYRRALRRAGFADNA